MSDKVQLDELDDLFRFRQRDVSDGFQSGAKLFGKRRQGPVRLLLLWVPGPKRSILRLVPSEETWFIVIGTLILITTIIAGLGAFATASYIMHGRLQADTAAIVFGLFWAIIIFFFDRALVRMPMNPVIFSPAAMDIVWGENSAKPSALENAVIRRWHDGLRVLATTLPRFVVAVAAAVIFAETLLFVYFEKDLEPVIQERAMEKRNSYLDKRKAEIEKEESAIRGDRDRWIRSNLPEVARLQNDIVDLELKHEEIVRDIRRINEAAEAEKNGQTGTFLWSDDGVRLTGNKGYGPATRTIEKASSAKVEARDANQASRDSKKGQIEDILANARSEYPELASYDKKLAQLKTNPPDSAFRGIGVRMDALHAYERDVDILTPGEVNEAPGCSEGLTELFLCVIPRFFVQPTPQGPIFAGIRWGLIFIELAPIFAKFAFVLRRRRPYDTLVAAQELIANGASVRLVGEQLARTGAVLEVCGSHNQAIRTAAGADLYLVNANVTSQRRPSWFDRLRKESPWGFGGSWHLMKKADELEDLSPSAESASKGGAGKPRR